MALTTATGLLTKVPASAAALITPTIDEFEQAYFYSSGQRHQESRSDDTHHHRRHQRQQQQQHTLSGLERIIDASLPCFSFRSPTIGASLDDFVDYDTGLECFKLLDSSLASLVTANSTSVSPGLADETYDDIDAMKAAGILCQFKNYDIMECSTKETAELVDMAVELLADDDSTADEQSNFSHDEHNDEPVAESLVYPNRLAIDGDSEEVNKLHQYVRKELLEIFVIPQQTSSESEDEDEEDDMDDDNHVDEEDECVNKDTSKQLLIDTSTTRHLVTRRRSIEVSPSPPSSAIQRYYPGRVGLRCTYCANIRRKSTSKAAFYPLRLKNIYREVCAWQRIHFKKCPHVPDGVRERYDHYKRIDTSRGKVRYWESSARKIGLENNPHREDGIVFAHTAWRA